MESSSDPVAPPSRHLAPGRLCGLLTEKLQAAGTKTQAPRNCRSAMQGISRGVLKKKKKRKERKDKEFRALPLSVVTGLPACSALTINKNYLI